MVSLEILFFSVKFLLLLSEQRQNFSKYEIIEQILVINQLWSFLCTVSKLSGSDISEEKY